MYLFDYLPNEYNFTSIATFLGVIAFSIILIYLKKYIEKSGEQKAEIENLTKRLQIQHEFNTKLEQEKKDISQNLESLKHANIIEVERLKRDHALEMEQIKQENIKKKIQYETKQKEFREFTNLLSSINFDSHNFLVDIIGQTMMDFQAAVMNGEKSKANELMIKFNQVAYDFTNNQSKNLGKIYSQTNGILLATSSEKIRLALNDLSAKIEAAQDRSNQYLQLIGNGQVNIQKTGTIFTEKFVKSGLDINDAREKLINLMREELDKI